jgi:hypothetical protein
MTFADFTDLLATSRATAAFRSDLEAFIARQPAERVSAALNNPRVKVLRAIAQLLHAEPQLAVDSVRVMGVSGCAEYTGTISVCDAEQVAHDFTFEWNCEWKARQLGWVDGFGFPDQIRAAQEFEWRCFSHWAPATPNVAAASA